MDRHIEYLTRKFLFLCNTLGSLAVLLWLCAFAATNGEAVPAKATSLFFSSASGEEAMPTLLSKRDATLYRDIFQAQKEGDWEAADRDIKKLDNKILLGDVLAYRYLHHYKSNMNELVNWLNKYSDHPQAPQIYAMTMEKAPEIKNILQPVSKRPVLEGFGDGEASLPDESPYAGTWRAGLEAWRTGNKEQAAQLFSSITKHKELSPWTLSAAAYWSYRSYNALGHYTEARKYLRLAAKEPRSFYGILARKQLGQRLNLDTQPVALTDSDIIGMIGEPAVERTITLAQVGMSELAEEELRALFVQSDHDEKLRLLALAHELNLASVQISMAKRMEDDDRAFDYAKYPVPNWRPEGGFKIAPELIFALMRQESGFRPSAVSSGGALGLMQLMPKTAMLMEKYRNNQLAVAANAAEPVLNMTLGQDYVRRLLDNELVEGNLFYMLTAYNAGPGRLQEWKSSLNYHGDPLLFVESIPFEQTRHYVVQVMTNYWIYCELADKPDNSVYAVARGHWPSYDEASWPVADAAQ